MELDYSLEDKNTLINIVCMYFAQLKSDEPDYKKHTVTLASLATFAGLSKQTIVNRKQAFDGIYPDNGRKGWHAEGSSLESRPEVKRTYDRFKDIPVDVLKQMKDGILEYIKSLRDERPFFSVKTKDELTVAKILNRDSNVTFDGINVLKDSIKIGNLVFIVLGGDKPNWETGLIGIGTISKEPFDEGYSGKNFKIDVDIKILLKKAIKREDLIPYKDTYGIIGIGPITKWEPNQALSQVEYSKAIALLRAMLEIEPSIENQLSSILSQQMIKEVKGFTTKMIPVEVSFDGSYDKSDQEFDDSIIETSLEKVSPYSKDVFLRDVYISSMQYDTIASILRNKKNIILQGAPGVGKTYMAKRLAYSIQGNTNNKNIKFVQFHQNYSYEDFVMGFRASESGFKLSSGPFFDFCKKAEQSSEPHFFIIDEINRANISKVFGELLMLIEKSHRNEKILLTYDKTTTFCVPNNLFIIGMMNTADRSLAIMDYALRRRFAFFELLPAFDHQSFIKEHITKEYIADVINKIKQLNEEIMNDESLGKGFCIGHSYFCSENELSKSEINNIISYEIIPLIEEYWFDEPSKVLKWTDILNGRIAK